MKPTLIRLLGALAPSTRAGTMAGMASAAAVVLTKVRRDIRLMDTDYGRRPDEGSVIPWS